MPLAKTFEVVEDFRQSLDQRLRNLARGRGLAVQILRRRVAFSRLLARLQRSEDSPWVLKGGHAMELVLSQPRATVDLDVVLASRDWKLQNEDDWKRLQTQLGSDIEFDLEDGFSFSVGYSGKPLMAPIYGGYRFLVDAKLGHKRFERFSLDISCGEGVQSRGALGLCGG